MQTEEFACREGSDPERQPDDDGVRVLRLQEKEDPGPDRGRWNVWKEMKPDAHRPAGRRGDRDAGAMVASQRKVTLGAPRPRISHL